MMCAGRWIRWRLLECVTCRAVYAEKAAAAHATVEEYALTSGCLLISQTQPGEKYQGPDGSWQTRTSSPPLRDSRCP